MVLGLFFIFCGVLIAIKPVLLSLIVAFLLILLGIFFIYLSYYYKKISHRFEDPFIDFFFRI